MRALTGNEFLRIWETGAHQHEIDRALTMLAVVLPEHTREELSLLPIGQRDAGLLAIWEATFGQDLNGFAVCPYCREALQLTVEVDDLRVTSTARGDDLFGCSCAGIDLQLRSLNSRDMAAVAHSTDLDKARQALLKRCVIQASRNGERLELMSISPEMERAIEESLEDYDPQSDVQLKLTCTSCTHQWSVVFDIASLLWQEVVIHAKRLLQEVHVLAKGYGWSEAEILSLSPGRRRLYLTMVAGDG